LAAEANNASALHPTPEFVRDKSELKKGRKLNQILILGVKVFV
jgi:hypothetical protein